MIIYYSISAATEFNEIQWEQLSGIFYTIFILTNYYFFDNILLLGLRTQILLRKCIYIYVLGSLFNYH
jgi:hypothetical protein